MMEQWHTGPGEIKKFSLGKNIGLFYKAIVVAA
jgi:hypothetical protein